MSEPAPEPTPVPTPAPTPAPQADPSPVDPPKDLRPEPQGQKVDDLPDWAQGLIRDLRKESGDRRTQATQAEQARADLLDGIAKALGIKSDDAPPDPKVLQQTLTEREARVSSLEEDVRTRDVELAAWRIAATQGANAAALLDSRSFLREVSGLDPAASDFSARVEQAVKTAVTANPSLRATPVVAPGLAGIGVAGNGGVSIADAPGRDLLRSAYSSTNP